jgi:beta-glucanase (GH16 family)
MKLVFLTNLVLVYSQICRNRNTTFGVDNFSTDFTMDYNPFNIIQRFGKGELLLTNEGGTRISSKNDIRYGRVDASIKISKGSNVITSFILMSSNGDEIDFEFVGKDSDLIQTNYFYKGEPVYNVNAIMYKVPVDLSLGYYEYSIIWTADYYQWLWNGNVLRTLYKNSTNKYPDSTSKVQFGIWNASKSEWAGNGIDWTKSPYTFYIDWVSIKCSNTLPTSTTTTKTEIPKSPNTTTTLKSTSTERPTMSSNTTMTTKSTSTEIPRMSSPTTTLKSTSTETPTMISTSSEPPKTQKTETPEETQTKKSEGIRLGVNLILVSIIMCTV